MCDCRSGGGSRGRPVGSVVAGGGQNEAAFKIDRAVACGCGGPFFDSARLFATARAVTGARTSVCHCVLVDFISTQAILTEGQATWALCSIDNSVRHHAASDKTDADASHRLESEANGTHLLLGSGEAPRLENTFASQCVMTCLARRSLSARCRPCR